MSFFVLEQFVTRLTIVDHSFIRKNGKGAVIDQFLYNLSRYRICRGVRSKKCASVSLFPLGVPLEVVLYSSPIKIP